MTDTFYFDPSQYEGSTYDLLPAGVYPAQVIEAGITVPQSQDGETLKFTWQVTEGECENRQVYQYIPFVHSSAKAQEIGRNQLKDMCVACDITTPISNPEQFKHIPCKIRVGVKKDKDGVYADKNVVTRVLPASYEPPASRARTASAKRHHRGRHHRLTLRLRRQPGRPNLQQQRLQQQRLQQQRGLQQQQ
jgi:hypothetical protein